MMKREFCKRGHLLAEPNVYYRGSNGRHECKQCKRDYQRRYRGMTKFPHHREGQSAGDKSVQYRRLWAIQARFLARLCEALNDCEYPEFDVLLVRRRRG